MHYHSLKIHARAHARNLTGRTDPMKNPIGTPVGGWTQWSAATLTIAERTAIWASDAAYSQSTTTALQ